MRPIPADAPVTRGVAAKALGVEPRTVTDWVRRGWYDPDGNHHAAPVVGKFEGRRLYRFGDLQYAEKCTRNNPNSSRNWKRGLPAEVVAGLSAA
jgi:hypothetical protein